MQHCFYFYFSFVTFKLLMCLPTLAPAFAYYCLLGDKQYRNMSFYFLVLARLLGEGSGIQAQCWALSTVHQCGWAVNAVAWGIHHHSLKDTITKLRKTKHFAYFLDISWIIISKPRKQHTQYVQFHTKLRSTNYNYGVYLYQEPVPQATEMK